MRRPSLLWFVGATAFLELLGIIVVAHLIGGGWTALLIVAGIVGGWLLARRAGRRSLPALAAALSAGRMPAAELANTGWTVLAGLLLMIPGFLTDLAALAVIVPFARRILGRRITALAPTQRPWVPPIPPQEGTDTEPTIVRGDVL